MAATSWHAGPDDSWHGEVSPSSSFTPEHGRYHLYISLFCPFAHRVNLVRVLKGLQEVIPVSVTKPYPKGDDNGWPGWEFPGCRGASDVYPGATEDHLFQSGYLHEVYFRADKEYKGRYSVPLLWDKKEDTIVNNESLETMRWLQTGFNDLLAEGSVEHQLTLYPGHLKAKIDEIKPWMTRDLNSGVYKAGFATSQEVYDKSVPIVFAALNQLELIIHKNGGPYILGKELTELDILAYATVIRFDVIYVQHFKCNLGMIRHDYPVIHEWLKNLYWNVKGFKETTDFKHIKENVSCPVLVDPTGVDE